MTFQHAFVARRDDKLGNLGREKTLQASDASNFVNLLGHPPFERAVPCLKIGCLCRYSIVRLSQIGGALAQLIEQPRVLDSDDGLGSEIGYQLDLLVAKWLHLPAIDADRTDQLVFFEHRDGDESPGAGRFEQGSAPRIAVVGRLSLNIGNLSRLLRCHHASEGRPGHGAYGRVAPRSSMYAAGALWCAATRKTSPSRRYSTPNVAPHRRVAFDSAVANTGCRLPGELEMTLSTSDVAVFCCSDSRSSLSSRAFSMAITAWLAKFLTKSICLSVNGQPPAGKC